MHYTVAKIMIHKNICMQPTVYCIRMRTVHPGSPAGRVNRHANIGNLFV